jgi:hypothetical protein
MTNTARQSKDRKALAAIIDEVQEEAANLRRELDGLPPFDCREGLDIDCAEVEVKVLGLAGRILKSLNRYQRKTTASPTGAAKQ